LRLAGARVGLLLLLDLGPARPLQLIDPRRPSVRDTAEARDGHELGDVGRRALALDEKVGSDVEQFDAAEEDSAGPLAIVGDQRVLVFWSVSWLKRANAPSSHSIATAASPTLGGLTTVDGISVRPLSSHSLTSCGASIEVKLRASVQADALNALGRLHEGLADDAARVSDDGGGERT